MHGGPCALLSATEGIGRVNQRMTKAALIIDLHPRILREAQEESGTYVAAPTPETTRQHISRREAPSLHPQFRATHSF
jgi:hypothetical protein